MEEGFLQLRNSCYFAEHGGKAIYEMLKVILEIKIVGCQMSEIHKIELFSNFLYYTIYEKKLEGKFAENEPNTTLWYLKSDFKRRSIQGGKRVKILFC